MLYLVHKLCQTQWIPSTHGTDITLQKAMFLYLLASETENLNIRYVIHENILKHFMLSRVLFLSITSTVF